MPQSVLTVETPGPKLPVSLDIAIDELLRYFSGNAWFIGEYWPLNDLRVRLMLTDLARLVPKGGEVFEPGCGNGFISYLASRTGYRVTATDAWTPPERGELFRSVDVLSFQSNFNDLDPWPGIPDCKFDAVLFGEVFEHLLNHPLGLLKQIHRVLKPGGTMILTTPNPSTLANAIRVLLDRQSLWGTDDFAMQPKFRDGAVIDNGDIHYREYRACELRTYLAQAGFRVNEARYLGLAVGGGPKRLIKRMLGPIMNYRPFALAHYFVVTKQ